MSTDKVRVPLKLRLKTKDNIAGRLQNMRFFAWGVLGTIFKYVWHGPEVQSWNLRFHIIRDVLRQYLAESLPHDMPNESAEKIDFAYVAEYIAINNLPSRSLQPDVGVNQEHDIVLQSENCVEYNVPHYGLSSDKLCKIAAMDLRSAQDGHPRTISCQVLLSTETGRFRDHDIASKNAPVSELLLINPLEPCERIILYFHGGAYCVGDRSLTHMLVYAHISRTTGLRVFSPNYRLAPKNCFPSQLHDCFASYMFLLRRGFKPENIIIAGDSAGSALAVGIMLILRDMNLPMPGAAVLISPWVDLTCSGESWKSNQKLDYLTEFSLDDPFHPTRMFYAAGKQFTSEMLEELRCPLVSPLFGKLNGMPPMLIQMGRDELLHDDIQAFATKASRDNAGGSKVKLEIYDNMPHAFVLFDFAEAAQKAFTNIGEFIRDNAGGSSNGII
ncbi:alpha/beta-hydrolase [Coemansia reversa NRRL 1564]|uniref:Alpha/beta-hydrolase n=1 Tax=Coemansia reversa (strain ATCC 12441 / NRRL 1564) TaxID=763665 RepID=A0A2G5B8C2_COERN|nr:alpha/beta-hydrolase [Coemansia reversa NRRL 1564]|eukprot:PIA14977.1 alpha/beta-hydrolase [Coemansia reversa NRRL 1564]